MSATVTLQCVKESGNKLRVRILSPGFIQTANCQFPRNIRAEGRLYSVPQAAVTLVARGSKYFYHINKSAITILGGTAATAATAAAVAIANATVKIHVYEDEDPTCVVCMSAPKTAVFVPCGHHSCCAVCTASLKNKCPMCRQLIVTVIRRDQVE
jgi:hypothetical protein